MKHKEESGERKTMGARGWKGSLNFREHAGGGGQAEAEV